MLTFVNMRTMGKSIAAILLLLASAVLAHARIEDGMLFRSYDVPAEQRSSLILPGGQNEWISFSDSVTVSFSIKIELNKGRFGYICRMDLDNQMPVDLLLSPLSDKPAICATSDHLNLIVLNNEEDDIQEWKDFYVKVFKSGDCLVMTANGKEIFRKEFKFRRHHIKLYFGKADTMGFATTDVAPMILADLKLKVDGKRSVSWALSDKADLVSHRGISIKAVNTLFMKDFNRQWTNVFTIEVPSASYACFSEDKSTIWYVSDGQVIMADVGAASCRVLEYGTDMKMNLVRGEFESLPDGTLIYADVERGQFIRFDKDKSEWELANGRTRTSTYLHHNSVFLPERGEYVQMFGYGQHHYSNVAFIWNPDSCSVHSKVLEGIEPRYLSAAGVCDGKIYVLGGKGNAAGRQELGAHLWSDFHEIEPGALSCSLLWRNDILSSMVPAHDLVFEDGGKSFLALLYNPELYESSLQLMRFDRETGKCEPLADRIPYFFSDVTSDARLCYNAEHDFYIAAVCYAAESGKHYVSSYILGAPVLSGSASRPSRKLPVWAILLVAALLLLIPALLLVRRHKGRSRSVEEEDIPMKLPVLDKPGIYLLGGFHVLDKDGNDIASSFSPTLVQFLSVLILYTAEKGGVSNAMLKSVLWPDKSDQSFNNNKGVNLNKLRLLLEQVGGVQVVSDGGNWKVEDNGGSCDYLLAKERLSGSSIQEILQVASWGPLLPEYHFDWLDKFKSRYTDLVFSRLDEIAGSGVSAETKVRAADCRLLFDSLDEDAMLQKCQALISLGKMGTAKTAFARFTAEYKQVMSEDFGTDFADFIKNNLH